MLTLILQLGLTMIVPILLCTLGGVWLGDKIHMSAVPVVGFVMGSIAGMQASWKLIKRMTASWPKDDLSSIPEQDDESRNSLTIQKSDEAFTEKGAGR